MSFYGDVHPVFLVLNYKSPEAITSEGWLRNWCTKYAPAIHLQSINIVFIPILWRWTWRDQWSISSPEIVSNTAKRKKNKPHRIYYVTWKSLAEKRWRKFGKRQERKKRIRKARLSYNIYKMVNADLQDLILVGHKCVLLK